MKVRYRDIKSDDIKIDKVRRFTVFFSSVKLITTKIFAGTCPISLDFMPLLEFTRAPGRPFSASPAITCRGSMDLSPLVPWLGSGYIEAD